MEIEWGQVGETIVLGSFGFLTIAMCLSLAAQIRGLAGFTTGMIALVGVCVPWFYLSFEWVRRSLRRLVDDTLHWLSHWVRYFI